TPEFLYWELAFALDRGKRMWTRLAPRPGTWTPGAVLPAIPVAGEDFNAFYDRKALNFFRDVDPKTKATVYSGESPDVSTHEQGHAILDALRPDLWNAPHFEVAAFHEAFGDLAAIFGALTEPVLDTDVVGATRNDPSRSNLVSRLAEQLGRAVRDAYGPDAAPPGALRDAVNAFRYEDPTKLPDSAPATALSAEPHSFCRVMTGAVWDVLVALFRTTPGKDRAAALSDAADRTARIVVAAADTAPSGAAFFAGIARRLVREAAARESAAAGRTIGELLVKRLLLDNTDVPDELSPDADSRVAKPEDDATGDVALVRAIRTRLPRAEGALLVRGTRGAAPEAAARLDVLRGRRCRDLRLSGREFGPADGACVEIADGFALGFDGGGFLRVSRVHPAEDRDVEDAKAFVRFLVRRRRIAEVAGFAPDSLALARERKTHAVVRDPDGVRRLKRIWIARRETP
ncbi:MAG TPA: hypothetical protein VFA98_11515, partial [Thermoanaerobaculia bacterium]|nr:hypothetical protein [Thermoanaerobaculia bacterium]